MKNSGLEIELSVNIFAALSNAVLRYNAAKMPNVTASGTATAGGGGVAAPADGGCDCQAVDAFKV